METIPEGYTQVSVEASLKDKIAGIDYTSQGISLWLIRLVKNTEEKDVYEILKTATTRLVDKYEEKLNKELTSSRNTAIDKLRKELSEEYEERLNKAKQEIIKLRKQLNGKED